MADLVTFADHGDGTSEIILNRPEKLNALNTPLVDDLHEAWVAFEASEALVTILRGEGRAFSVGADLTDNPLDLWRAVPGLGVEVSKPVIGALQGHCIGGAWVLAMYTDLVVAAASTRFSYPEAQVGFTGGIAAGLVARVPHKHAMEFLFLGEWMSAQRAYETGMINRVVPDGDELDVARAWARILADSAPLVLATLKRFVGQTLPVSPSEGAAQARRELRRVHESQDRFEGEAAFAEKRAPRYQGR